MRGIVAGVVPNVPAGREIGAVDPQRFQGEAEVPRVGAGVGRQLGHAVPLPQVPELDAIVASLESQLVDDAPSLEQAVGAGRGPVHDDQVSRTLVVLWLDVVIDTTTLLDQRPEPALDLVLVFQLLALGVDAPVQH
ncbi:hypothetical protein PG996_008866 [Apiospora saccharicola]|uniref:Uncharacterized protein n=1 Tax=Apiospora saccharicola TaxID=335842 RepID=A0ABR1UZ43_9PEZI